MLPRSLAEAEPLKRKAKIHWEETACLMCGAHSSETILEAEDPLHSIPHALRFSVQRCLQCDLIFTNPRPTPESIGHFYPADYRPHRRPRKIKEARSRSRFYDRLTGRKCQERQGILPWTGTGRLLDFGCGSGSYLKRMADRGWDVTGLDASVGAVQIVQQLGLKALTGTLPHPALKPCSFEIITFWHSIEHVFEPLKVLQEAFKLLIPGGKVILACPNIDSWAFRRFQEAWFGLDLPRHLAHFTTRSLPQLLQSAGFQVEDVRTIRHSDWLRSSAKRALKLGQKNALNRLLLWKPAAKFTTWLTYLFGQSDCLVVVAVRP